MKLVVDPDVQAVAEFMQERMSAYKLVAIANGLSALARILWGDNEQRSTNRLRLYPESSSKPLISRRSSPDPDRVDGDSGVVAAKTPPRRSLRHNPHIDKSLNVTFWRLARESGRTRRHQFVSSIEDILYSAIGRSYRAPSALMPCASNALNLITVPMNSDQQVTPGIVLVLLERVLETIRESGATEEEAIAMLQSAEAIVPLLKLQSRYRQGWLR